MQLKLCAAAFVAIAMAGCVQPTPGQFPELCQVEVTPRDPPRMPPVSLEEEFLREHPRLWEALESPNGGSWNTTCEENRAFIALLGDEGAEVLNGSLASVEYENRTYNVVAVRVVRH